MAKEQSDFKQESIEQYEKITIKEEPCFNNINNMTIEENLKIKSEPIENNELDLYFNPDKNMIIKEEFSEIFVKSETFVDPSEFCDVQIKNEDEGNVLEIQETLKHDKESEKKFQSPICLKVFKTESYIAKHILRVHEGNKLKQQDEAMKLQCSICLKKFTSKYNVKEHISNVHQEQKDKKEFVCSICFKVFGVKDTLEKHISHFHEKNKTYQCPFCPVRFRYRGEFNRHLTKVHEGKEISEALEKKKPLQCSSCSKKFSYKSLLNRHIALVHEGKKLSLQDSSNVHEGEKLDQDMSPNTTFKERNIGRNMKFPCHNCSKVFHSKNDVNKHVSRVHEEIKLENQESFTNSEKSKVSSDSELCNIQIKNEDPLEIHEENKILRVHEGNKLKFQCSICLRSFTSNHNVKRHIAHVHEENKPKPFKCSLCDSSFGSRGALKLHIDSVHEKKKPFKCSQCEYRTTQKCHLKTHVKTVHDGTKASVHKKWNKPNQCPNCPARFEYRGELNNHLNLVHGGRVFNA